MLILVMPSCLREAAVVFAQARKAGRGSGDFASRFDGRFARFDHVGLASFDADVGQILRASFDNGMRRGFLLVGADRNLNHK